MTHKNLGPKTGSFEPPSECTFDKPRVTKKLLDEIGKMDSKYEDLFHLTAELIMAYERKDKKDIDRLIKEFREIQ